MKAQCSECSEVVPLGAIDHFTGQCTCCLERCGQCSKCNDVVLLVSIATETGWCVRCREREKLWPTLPHTRAADPRWLKRKQNYLSKWQKLSSKNKQLARNKCDHAIRHGFITPPPTCQECATPFADAGSERRQAHHHDYSKPFEVDWLCVRCHARRHTAARGKGTGKPGWQPVA
jgi:hypothetical protein